MLDPFQLEFVQRGVLEVLLLSGAAGLLGTWIVMRGLSFYAHAVGTAAFPGLVLADGIGFAAPLGAFAAALVFAFGVERLARRPRAGYDSLTALVLVAALAGGVVLASDVYQSGGNVDSLLFGSLLLTDTIDLVLAGLASAAALAATLALGPRWLARGFDPAAARAMGLRSQWPDAVLLVLIAFAVVASLTAIGALLAAALFIVPAATVRLWTQRLPVWQLASVALAAVLGIAGLWLSVQLNTPPGPTIAVLGGAAFVVSLAWHQIAAVARTRAALVGAAALLALALGGCGGGGSTQRGHRRGRHHDAAGRLGARRRRAMRPTSIRSCSPTATRTSTSRARPTSRRSPMRRSCSRAGTVSMPGWARSSRTRAARPQWSIWARRCPCTARARARATRRRATTRTGGTTRATRSPPSRRSATP